MTGALLSTVWLLVCSLIDCELFESRRYALSILLEETKSQVVCHWFHFAGLNLAQYVHWRDFFCNALVADGVAESACNFRDGNGAWFYSTDVVQPNPETVVKPPIKPRRGNA